MKEKRNERQSEYAKPRVEKRVTAEELERNVQYAGGTVATAREG